MSWQVASFVVLGGVLLGGFAWYERSRPPSQIVALVAALAALAVAGRLLFAAIPNVVATTDIVLFTGFSIGAAPGFAVGALAGLVSNFWLGQGPWTPWQMAGWGMVGVFGAGLATLTGRRLGRVPLAAACGIAAIAYGALLNYSLMATYGGDQSLSRFVALSVRAIPFDLAHAIGNVALALAAGPAMVRMLVRFRRRFEVDWVEAEPGAPRSHRVPRGAVATCLVATLVAAALGPPSSDAAGSRATAAWLVRAQNTDGGFPASPGGPSSAAITGWAILGLEATGRNPLDVQRAGHTPVDYLRRHTAGLTGTGDMERTILALRGAGLDPRRFAGRDLVSGLRANRRRDGSFDGQVNLTAFGVMALRSAHSPVGSRTLGWLHRAQNRDGGWGYSPGAASDPDSTGAALQAVRRGRSARRGVAYLRRAQRAGGGYGLATSGTPNAQSTAWAVQGLIAAGARPAHVRQNGKSPLRFLRTLRASDGHYRYSLSSNQTPVWVTAQTLMAVKRRPFPLAPVARAHSAKHSAAGANAAPSAGGGGSRPRTAISDAGRGRFPGQDPRPGGQEPRPGAGGPKSLAAPSAGGGGGRPRTAISDAGRGRFPGQDPRSSGSALEFGSNATGQMVGTLLATVSALGGGLLLWRRRRERLPG